MILLNGWARKNWRFITISVSKSELKLHTSNASTSFSHSICTQSRSLRIRKNAKLNTMYKTENWRSHYHFSLFSQNQKRILTAFPLVFHTKFSGTIASLRIRKNVQNKHSLYTNENLKSYYHFSLFGQNLTLHTSRYSTGFSHSIINQSNANFRIKKTGKIYVIS